MGVIWLLTAVHNDKRVLDVQTVEAGYTSQYGSMPVTLNCHKNP